MNTLRRVVRHHRVVFCVVVLALAAASLRAADDLPAVARAPVNAPVTIRDEGASWIMDNGIIKAAINKRNCHVTSGVVYDYLRLELNANATPGGAPTPVR